MTQGTATTAVAVNGPWKLPKGWDWVPLGALCQSIIGGGTPDRSNPNYWGGDIPWASVKDLNTEILLTTQESITLQGLENSSAKLVVPGTIIVATRMGLGKVSLAQIRIAINQDLKGLILTPRCLPEYIRLFLKSCSRELERQGAGATVKGIKLEELKAWAVPIPYLDDPQRSLDIQSRIVARIEALMAEVIRARGLLEQMRQGVDLLMDAALAELVTRVPHTRRPLVEVVSAKPRNGWSPKCDNKPAGIPVLKLGAVLGFRYDSSEVKRTSEPVNYNAHYWLQPDDILISRSNTLELVGHASIYTGNPSPCIYPDLLMRFRVHQSEADNKFLIYWLRTKEVRTFIKSCASGSSPTMQKIKQDDVCNIPFPTIDVNEQLQYVVYLDSIQSSLERLKQLLDQDTKLLDQMELSILERAFRGEL